jgi:hypothetical protein
MSGREAIFAIIGGMLGIACGLASIRKSRKPGRQAWWQGDEPGDLETAQGITLIVGGGFCLIGSLLVLMGIISLIHRT